MKERTLRTRLWRARTLLKTWKRALHDGHVERGGPNNGKVTDPQMLRELEAFDEAIQALTEAIRLARTPQLGPPPGRNGGLTQCDMHEDESC